MPRSDGRRHRLDLDDVPGVPGSVDTSRQASTTPATWVTRRCARTRWANAPSRKSQWRRPARHGARAARRDSRRRHRLHDLALAEPRDSIVARSRAATACGTRCAGCRRLGRMNAGVRAGRARQWGPRASARLHVRPAIWPSDRPAVTWGLFSRREEPDLWRTYVACSRDGGPRRAVWPAQVQSRAHGRFVQDPAALRSPCAAVGASRLHTRGQAAARSGLRLWWRPRRSATSAVPSAPRRCWGRTSGSS
jgi:hypothetical protein